MPNTRVIIAHGKLDVADLVRLTIGIPMLKEMPKKCLACDPKQEATVDVKHRYNPATKSCNDTGVIAVQPEQ